MTSGAPAEPAAPYVEADRERCAVVADTCTVVCLARNTTKQPERANFDENKPKRAGLHRPLASPHQDFQRADHRQSGVPRQVYFM
jgi:hypothetical protein